MPLTIPVNIRHVLRISFAAAFPLLLISCSGSKYLPAGEQLYIGAEVHVLPDSGTMSAKKQLLLKNELISVTRPKPNTRLLGLARVKLWFYNIAYTKKEKGIKHLIQTSLGEPPVLFSRVSPKSNEDIL